ncbi:MAG: hypothetical protein ABI934_10325, partial [Actinomycetota bacterium]
MAANEFRNVTTKFATADGGTFSRPQGLTSAHVNEKTEGSSDRDVDHSQLSAPPKSAEDAAGVDMVSVTKRYLTPKGEAFTAIQDVTLTVEPGQFCAIV